MVFREGEERELDLEVGELDRQSPASHDTESRPETSLGMSFRTLDDQLARQLGFERSPGGVLVTAVEAFSAAERAGLRARDVIIALGGEEIRDALDLQSQLRGSDLERGVRITVLTNGTQRFVFLRAG